MILSNSFLNKFDNSKEKQHIDTWIPPFAKSASCNGIMFAAFHDTNPNHWCLVCDVPRDDQDSMQKGKAELKRLWASRGAGDDRLMAELMNITLSERRQTLVLEQPRATPQELLGEYPLSSKMAKCIA